MDIPVIKVEGKGIAEVWEKSILQLWEKGAQIKTEYDDPKDPPSRDGTMIMLAREPFAEPRIHLAFPGGMEDLEKYRQEIVLGIHDKWINPEEGSWTYTYHKRLFDYPQGINQINYIVEKLSQSDYSRRAQAITWIPSIDPPTDDPPCLQRVWCRIVKEEGKLFLNMHTHWRSRDAYRAAFMNLFGLTDLQRFICEKITKKRKEKIFIGHYLDISDSYHIYGSNFSDFEERFLKLQKKREFYNQERIKSRTMRSDDAAAIAGFQYGRELLKREQKTGKRGATF
ncbi:Thymidylate synthase [subsurface metagenome]